MRILPSREFRTPQLVSQYGLTFTVVRSCELKNYNASASTTTTTALQQTDMNIQILSMNYEQN